jgi:hypothetical protein
MKTITLSILPIYQNGVVIKFGKESQGHITANLLLGFLCASILSWSLPLTLIYLIWRIGTVL